MNAASVSGLGVWAVEALIASALLMALVLLVRAPVRRAFGPAVAYALWALPVLRLLLPPMPSGWREAAATPITRAGETITIFVTSPAGSAVVASTPALSWLGPVSLGLWGVGAAAFLAWHLTAHADFCRRIMARGRIVATIDGIDVVESDAAPGPVAFGLLRRCVAFPGDFADRYDADERELALAHELGHHARGDLIANWAALVVLALHWFNPLAWAAFRAFRNDQELANDARVLNGRSAVDRHIYACAIVKAAHGGAVSAACHLHTIADLKGRLRMLTTTPASRRQLAAGAATIALVITAGLGLTASGTAAVAAVTTRVGDSIGVDLSQAAVPATTPERASPPNAADIPESPAPPAPVSGTTSETVSVTNTSGKPIQVRTIRARNGQVVTTGLTGMPTVSETDCKSGTDGGDQQLVVTRKVGARNVMLICTNRIEKVAANGAATAANAEQIRRDAMASAIAGLNAGRAAIANAPMSDADRAEALKDLDAAEAEVRAEIASQK
ncbi:hypothetical protein ASE75_07555 [Sphingomonas sp. Leaf17]|uniref:M56 family metallopeptidase n=1 Tax=Sphingomonas sp. Leaf17 TaxID=1735683 RepID=UPI0006F35A26|nr:M56 family metallopeptidase [Sphingomonas sp. Leaf17]KQM64919.1 hypothetical protein ASE75_07555 [Sphingomonas sp. Leaf17]